MLRRRDKPNRWKGFVLGMVGGVAGVLAMRAYWQIVSEQVGHDPRQASKPEGQSDALDSISIAGVNHEPDESSTAALGRILFKTMTGKAPRAKETRTMLSYLVHWVFSMLMSGLYGAMRGRADVPDLAGGMRLGAGLWFVGDEGLMPLVGLTDGPTAYAPETHVHSLGAHMAYGIACSLATQLLHRVF